MSNPDLSHGYVCEPEYNEDEMKAMKSNSSNTADESDETTEDELNSSRLENLHWCKCSYCTVMPSFIECKCCQECKGLLGDKLDSGCVTSNINFV